MAKTVAEKLFIKPSHKVCAVGAPASHARFLGGFPKGARSVDLDEKPDVVHVFVRSAAEVLKVMPGVLTAISDDTVLWISYPKAGALKTDLTRDTGWEPVFRGGWGPVSQVSVDETWSALRFKPDHQTSRKPGSVVAARVRKVAKKKKAAPVKKAKR